MKDNGTGGFHLWGQTRSVSALIAVLVTLLLSGCSVWTSEPSDPTTPIEVPIQTPAPADPEPLPQPKPEPEPAPAPKPQPDLVPYTGRVEHIFFHPLIAYPELAFDNDAMTNGFDDWFVTVPEFTPILESLHAKGYMLIDIHALFDVTHEDGRPVYARKELRLPRGKKPLILSIDDLNYYEYMRVNGTVHKLVLDDQNRVATLTVTPEGERVIAYDNEIVPLLDAFVEEHPDFSLHGAKGVIALTGYEGILGYQTHDRSSPAYESEKQEALRVVKRLKETGWTFASHGWGHLDAAKISQATLDRDTRRWKDEVEPLIGPTPVYIYPFGSVVEPGSPKFQTLMDLGFQIFCGVGPDLHLHVSKHWAVMNRKHIDGLAFRLQRDLLIDLFDPNELIDPARPRR